jgi:linoleoyl-CoA desaturase
MSALLQHVPESGTRTYADLTPREVEEIGQTLDALRQEVLDSRGAADAAYIRRLIAVQRCLEVAGRVVLLVVDATSSLWPVTVASAALRRAGAHAVLPLLLHRRP